MTRPFSIGSGKGYRPKLYIVQRIVFVLYSYLEVHHLFGIGKMEDNLYVIQESFDIH